MRFRQRARRQVAISAAVGLLAACHSRTADLVFPKIGSTSAPAGRGSFRFGVSTAATQIEDQNTATDWYLWTSPPPQGLGKDTFVGNASMGYTKAIDDVALLQQLHVDSYRLSLEWARIEPARHQIDEAAIAHYRQVLEALVAAGIRPMVTVVHYSNPVWVDDPRDPSCANGPTDANMCGFGNPAGAPMILQALQEHATLLGQRFGDLVDDWCTENEAAQYLLAGYGLGIFPPGKVFLFDFFGGFMPVARGYLAAHAAIYDGLKQGDTVDADGDGIAASVGFSVAVADWVASRDNKPSTNAADVAALNQNVFINEYSFVDSMLQGGWSTHADGVFDEPHPEWKGKLDWLGIQYYLRAGVTGETSVVSGLNFVPCGQGFDLGSCVPPLDPSFHVPVMDYDYSPEGLYNVLARYSERYPQLPLTVTESGMATRNGTRRAQVLVRALEQIARARSQGIDVRGMYHWSLIDNLEWARGFTPRFGLFSVDYGAYARTPTEAATVYGQVASTRRVTASQRLQYGGLGPLAPEP